METTARRISFRKESQVSRTGLMLGSRVLAAIVDFFILDLTLVPLIGIVFVLVFGWDSVYEPLFVLPILIAVWLYFSVMEWKAGGSLGKRLFRLHVTNKEGSKIIFLQSFLRFPLKIVSAATVVGILMIDINPHRQALHDLICGTLVRRK
ncbi:hypothetical protein C943_04218 [Mariniradius saccharolyticus AK6]|uniref:RDD domain-containing protein n=1 Tax=Mariniradius saccharolyticus AK6 TaxID=1239962 RepID=M7XGG8_9BACT|nr:RDD family protein [Mariniradius saccharolyticus]EMS33899.1 hypothetical protein C943_04218 [Mariniradius saccharolyticus AK6]